jgi:inner membrane protein
MTGKTHLSVGVMTALAVTHPTDLKNIVLCVSTAAVGALLCDVDVTRSEAKTKLNQVIGIIVGAVALALIANRMLNINVYSYIKQSSNLFRMLSGFIILVGICIFGEKTPHRSFMHSLLGLVAANLAVYFISPVIGGFFMPAMISHIAIDMLNKRDVRLLYPLKNGVSLGLCKSDGVVSRVMFIAATAGIILYISSVVLIFIR